MFNLTKKRTLRGAKHPMAKLTWADAEKIREEYAKGGISYSQLAKIYGVSPGTVGRIVRKELWLRDKNNILID